MGADTVNVGEMRGDGISTGAGVGGVGEGSGTGSG